MSFLAFSLRLCCCGEVIVFMLTGVFDAVGPPPGYFKLELFSGSVREAAFALLFGMIGGAIASASG